MALIFDEGKHLYYWDGKLVPGVTALLEPIHSFEGVPKDILDAAQKRGTFVHRMTQMYDQGDLDEPRLGSVAGGAYLGYLAAWKKFLNDSGAQWDDIEAMAYHFDYAFAGTWDRFGLLPAVSRDEWLIDIKTGADLERSWGVQTAAYRALRASWRKDDRGLFARRGTVQLRSDGDYLFHEWTDPMDWPTFHALLTLHNWRSKK